MRARRLVGISFASAVVAGVASITLACSAGNDKDTGPGKLGPGNTTPDGGGLNVDDAGFSGDAGESDAACASATFSGKKVPASVLILLDRSGSMSDGGKWSAAVSALKSALAKADADLPVGLLFYPEGKWTLPLECTVNPSAGTCPAVWADGGCKDIRTTPDVAVAPLSTSKPQIDAKLGSTSPNGDTTPTRWALKNSWAHMKTVAAKGDRFVLLVTDGEPSTHSPPIFTIPESNLECKDKATIEAEATAAATGAPSVKTFVIGAPGSEKAAPHLSQIAFNGQTPKDPSCTPSAGNCHYQIGAASFEADLAKVIEEITGKIATCIFEVPTGTDVDPNKVNVTVEAGGKTTDLYQDSKHADGWDYTDGSKSRIEIHGPACEEIKKNAGSASVKILLGCVTRVK